MAAFAIVLGLGFAIHWQAAGISDNVFGAAAALAIAGISFAIYYLLNPSQFSLPRSLHRLLHRKIRGTSQPIAAAPLERREQWTDDQILYNENPRMVATCPHLQTIAYAMLLAGFKLRLDPLRPSPAASVSANCRIHEADLKLRFALPEPVQYREYFMPERAATDNPTADLFCSECKSTIRVVHPVFP